MKKTTIKGAAGALAALSVAGLVLPVATSVTANAAAKVGGLDVAYNNPKKAIKNGTLKAAYISDTPFVGQWVQALSNDATSSSLEAPALGASIWTDKNFKFIKGGPVTLTVDDDAKTVTLDINKDYKWSDGSDVTAKDFEFEYELIANPAYGSDRYTDSLANIEGLEEYHEGKATSISGLEMPDGENGKKLVVHFKEMKPAMDTSGNGYFLETPEPYQYLKDVKPEDLAKDAKTTTKPLTLGPFKVKKIVAGESISYERNPYYFGKKANLKQVTYSIVAPSKAVASAKAKEYDFYNGASNDLYDKFKKVSGYKITGQQSLYFSAMYYNLGHYDTETSMNVTDRKTPLQNVKVRQALGYARNVAQVLKKYDNGLATLANTTIPPVFSAYANKSVKAYDYNEKKANKLLDEAGYKWHDSKKKDYRVDPETGKKLSLVYLARSGTAASQTTAQNYIQKWKAVGVKVTLYKNKMTDFNTWVSMMTDPTSDQNWDITDGAWSLSSDPSQQDLFSASAPYNFGHFTSEKLTTLLNNIDSDKAFSKSYRVKAFKAYQKYVHDSAFIIPTKFTIDYTPVNERVKNFSNAFGQHESWSKLAVTSKK